MAIIGLGSRPLSRTQLLFVETTSERQPISKRVPHIHTVQIFEMLVDYHPPQPRHQRPIQDHINS